MFDRLAIPIIQAPMVGASTPAMALAVCHAGGMGALGFGGTPPAEIEGEIKLIRSQTDAPFLANLFVIPPARPDAAEIERATERLRPWYEARGLEPPAPPNTFAPDFDAQFEALVTAAPPAASFTFGIPSGEQIAALKARGTLVIGTITNIAEARAWADAGADALCAQGGEGGGHRNTFIGEAPESLIGTMALVPLARAATGLPVIAAGGIMDGRGVAAALALGAVAAQMGTAFLLSDQTGISGPWQGAIRGVADDATRVTRVYTGRYARGIENEFMRKMRPMEQEVPAYPVQNRLTQPLRAAAAKAGDPEVLSLWAGQAVKLVRGGDAGDLVRRWWAEAKSALAETARDFGPTG